MKINKDDFFNKLDKINLLDYLIDYKRNMNYFYYKNYKYCLCSEIVNGKLEDTFYKFEK